MPFQPGIAANPRGRPIGAMTWQKFADRAWHLMEKYDIDQILDYGKDNKKLAKVCSYTDGMIVKRLARAFEDGKEMERLLDRLLGKSIQRIAGENPGDPIKIASANVVRYEVLDDDTLMALASVLKQAKEKQAALTIEQTQDIDSSATQQTQESE